MSENLMLIKSRNNLTGNKNEEHWGNEVATMQTEHAEVIAMEHDKGSPIIARHQDVAFAA